MSFVPSAKIESLRFRSVAFATPTAALPTEDPEKDANQRAKREKERAAAWKAKQNTDGEDAELDKAKVFIDAKGKRKVAFIKKDVRAPPLLYSLTISTYITLLTSNNNSSTLRLTLVTPMSSLLILTLTELPMLPLSSIPLRLPPSSSPLRTAALFPGVRSASTLSAYLLLSGSPARPLP